MPDCRGDARVIGVQPNDLVGRQQREVDQAAVDRAKCQRLETQHRALAAGDGLRLGHDNEVLDPDAVCARLVVAGLVGEDHAGLENRVAGARDARRTFMHREKRADAVARAVIEVEAGVPERTARE